jgi:2-keto-4-pentenoate hydratase/2-oxohepta-3-ene-1,7-dioic acid hydratase in catechol pathway
LSLLEDWERSFPRLEAASERAARVPADTLTALPPIFPPGAYLLASANYRRHVIEMRVANAVSEGRDRGDAEAEATRAMDERATIGIPLVFVGWPGAVVGANDDVIIPDDGGVKHDWELELGVVIGRFARCVAKEEAMGYVAGYTIVNDISTRDRMHRSDLRQTDFVATKMRPGFKPIGPWITPARFVEDPHDLRMTLKVNGEIMQDESTADMIFSIPRLIEHSSGMTDLRPGDIIATGSPAGNAAHHGGRWLTPGDVIESEIEGLGAQRNRCIAATARPHGPDLAPAFRPREN